MIQFEQTQGLSQIDQMAIGAVISELIAIFQMQESSHLIVKQELTPCEIQLKEFRLVQVSFLQELNEQHLCEVAIESDANLLQASHLNDLQQIICRQETGIKLETL